ncbi:hypothetical protein HK098_006707 [Nowakowskiella sp. JEL0407]|nr:hypothetical protein HK098_006707 [Nowakowskiella sp. JEL0407]
MATASESSLTGNSSLLPTISPASESSSIASSSKEKQSDQTNIGALVIAVAFLSTVVVGLLILFALYYFRKRYLKKKNNALLSKNDNESISRRSETDEFLAQKLESSKDGSRAGTLEKGGVYKSRESAFNYSYIALSGVPSTAISTENTLNYYPPSNRNSGTLPKARSFSSLPRKLNNFEIDYPIAPISPYGDTTAFSTLDSQKTFNTSSSLYTHATNLNSRAHDRIFHMNDMSPISPIYSTIQRSYTESQVGTIARDRNRISVISGEEIKQLPKSINEESIVVEKPDGGFDAKDQSNTLESVGKRPNRGFVLIPPKPVIPEVEPVSPLTQSLEVNSISLLANQLAEMEELERKRTNRLQTVMPPKRDSTLHSPVEDLQYILKARKQSTVSLPDSTQYRNQQTSALPSPVNSTNISTLDTFSISSLYGNRNTELSTLPPAQSNQPPLFQRPRSSSAPAPPRPKRNPQRSMFRQQTANSSDKSDKSYTTYEPSDTESIDSYSTNDLSDYINVNTSPPPNTNNPLPVQRIDTGSTSLGGASLPSLALSDSLSPYESPVSPINNAMSSTEAVENLVAEAVEKLALADESTEPLSEEGNGSKEDEEPFVTKSSVSEKHFSTMSNDTVLHSPLGNREISTPEGDEISERSMSREEDSPSRALSYVSLADTDAISLLRFSKEYDPKFDTQSVKSFPESDITSEFEFEASEKLDAFFTAVLNPQSNPTSTAASPSLKSVDKDAVYFGEESR